MVIAYGQIYLEGGFQEGYVEFEEGEVKNVRLGKPSRYELKGIIVPPPHNAHVHLLDSCLRDLVEERKLELVVSPPNGIKFRGISSKRPEELKEGIRRSLQEMSSFGIGIATEFREGGEKYYDIWPEGGILRVLSRPRTIEEAERLIKKSSGFNFSSVSDESYSFLEEASRICKREGKLFALHFSENKREPLREVIDLGPDFLVHCCKASEEDLREISEREIPVVICPRENSFFGIETPIAKMIEEGVRLMIGTDNAMIISPDVFSELSYAYYLYRLQGGEKAIEIIRMAFRDFSGDFSIEEGTKKVLVFEVEYGKPELSMISRVPSSRPKALF